METSTALQGERDSQASKPRNEARVWLAWMFYVAIAVGRNGELVCTICNRGTRRNRDGAER